MVNLIINIFFNDSIIKKINNNLFVGNLRLNGNALGNQVWDSIAQSGYVTTTFNVPSGQSHTLRTTSGARFAGRLYGRADRESYAFPVGFRFQ